MPASRAGCSASARTASLRHGWAQQGRLCHAAGPSQQRHPCRRRQLVGMALPSFPALRRLWRGQQDGCSLYWGWWAVFVFGVGGRAAVGGCIAATGADKARVASKLRLSKPHGMHGGGRRQIISTWIHGSERHMFEGIVHVWHGRLALLGVCY